MAEADADRFTRIYRRTYPAVLGYALRRTSREAAHEAAAEAFLVAWRRRSDVPEPTLPWLLVVTRNILADQRRGGRRADAVQAEVERLATTPTHPDLSDHVVDRSVLMQAVAALPELDREALVLTVWDGLSHRAAATVAGCSIGAFAVRVHRARRRLRAELDRFSKPNHTGAPTAPIARMEAR